MRPGSASHAWLSISSTRQGGETCVVWQWPGTLSKNPLLITDGELSFANCWASTRPLKPRKAAGNTFSDNSTPIILRGLDDNRANFPTVSQVDQILATNGNTNTTYAYVIDP